jgi:hypothetical protein
LYQKRRQEIFTPLQEDVGKALDVYAKALVSYPKDSKLMPA